MALFKRIHRRRGGEHPEPGFEGQVDFGQYKMPDMYGGVKRVYFFVMALSYSNMRYAYFNHEPFTTATAIMAHEYAFRYFGGRPCQLCYDQDRVFVVNENLGDIILVKEFEEYVEKWDSVCIYARHTTPAQRKSGSTTGISSTHFLTAEFIRH